MLQQTLQPGINMALPQQTAATSPFEDIAATHALYEPRIFRLLLLSVRDRDLALSLTQDTFLKVWRTREQFRGDCSEATWITRIAVSLLRSHTRTETFRFWKRAEANSIDADELAGRLSSNTRSAEAALIARQSLAQVWQAVEQLSQRQRTIFLLRFVEELELGEIAQAVDIPLSTVKSHLYRALNHIHAACAAVQPPATGKARS